MKYLAIFTIVIILFFIYRNYKNSQFLNINFKKFIILIISFEFVMIFFIIYELNVLDRLESAMATLQLEKYEMVLVAKVLRQSSDDLSHYARSYAVTNNTEYKQNYLDILAIRNGTKARPKNYHSIYWDLEPELRSKDHPDGEKLSLKLLLDQQPYSQHELDLLHQSESNSNDLVNIEVDAFRSMENGEQAHAVEALHSKAYYLAKSKIMEPIDKFLVSIEQRTNAEDAILKQNIVTVFNVITLVSIAFALGNFLIYLMLIKKIREPLSYLVKAIKRFKSGDKSVTEQVFYSDEIGTVSNEFFSMKTMIEKQAEEVQVQLDFQIESETRIRAIIDNSQEGIILINQKREIISWNKAAGLILGYSESEIIKKVVDDLLSDEVKASQEDGVTAYFRSLVGVGSVELSVIHKDGRIVPIEMSLSTFKIKSQTVFSASFRDVSERKKAEYELKVALSDAELATQAKSDFLANMSHEIRTPMNAIIGMSYLALQTSLDRKQYNYVDKVHRSAESLLGIINDILDFSKIEAGKLDMEEIDFQLEDIFDSLASLVGIKAEEKGLELLFDLPVDLPTSLVGDPLRLGQILTNLGNNAVKFTEHGEVVLSVTVLEQSDDVITLKFVVRDTGVGMNEQQQTKLFKSFSQADTSTTREYGGTGLGLVISKKLTEMMGGKIWVESEEGVGSKFQFTASFGKHDGQMKRQRTSSENIENTRVLVVDDNASSREILSVMLSSFGMLVDQAESGQTALDKLKLVDSSDPYQLVLMDWKMPGLDGIETTRLIQNNEDLIGLPTVIMITGHGRDEASQASDGVLIESYLTKPVTSSTLLDTIMLAMGHEITSKTRSGTREELVLTDINKLRGAHVLLVEDNEINQELALELLTTNGMTVVVANHGQEALEHLDDEVFDGVLMDCQMPVMDGYEATRNLRKQERFKDLPILAMTANAMVGDREKVLEAGMNDHIAKPINVNNMFQTMAKWIVPANPTEETVVSTDEQAEINIPELVGINTKAGLERTQNNKKLYHKILVKFASSQAQFIEEFDNAVISEDWELATRLVHTLKGLAGNIGADDLQQVSAVVEAQSNQQQLISIDRDAVKAELERILDSLSVLSVDKPVESVNVAVDPELLRKVLSDLKLLLEEDDTDAQEILDEHHDMLSSGKLRSGFKELEKALDEYDFEEALEALARMQSY